MTWAIFIYGRKARRGNYEKTKSIESREKEKYTKKEFKKWQIHKDKEKMTEQERKTNKAFDDPSQDLVNK